LRGKLLGGDDPSFLALQLRGGTNVPRGRIRFNARSPDDPGWFEDPEEAVRRIAARNKATYVEGSLAFSPNGQTAEALFETVEPEETSEATRLHQLAIDLDAFEAKLLISRELWRGA
jgi:hypothetical protein